ncbi:type II secretion system F family protein, partial [Sinomonas sp. G460-2]|uniref:type II secretion system F family protein n=1 Tax=Sinomonas sp. G460-2 TaxID=3393464 RepID=UPI0039F07DAD
QAIREAAGLIKAGATGPHSSGRPRHHVLQEVPRCVWGDVAACIEVAEESGCPLAGVFDRLAAQLEADADAAAARATALAGPRATTRILSFLPLVGLAMGALLGVDPLGVLLGTPWGGACLAAGLALTIAGRVWSSRLVAAAGAVR